MQGMVQWLVGIELQAGLYYLSAAKKYLQHPKLARFLKHLAEDEARHYRMLKRAAHYLQRDAFTPPSELVLDDRTKEAIEKLLRKNVKRLTAGEFTHETLLTSIIDIEYSELNDLFRYVLDTLKELDPEFQQASSEIHHHLKRIEHFAATVSDAPWFIDKLKRLPAVWKERILITEDTMPIAGLLAAFLKKQGSVDVAGDTQQALAMAQASYYDVIITDVEEPSLDGLRFYRLMLNRDPHIGRRFLFISKNPSGKCLAYLKKHCLQFLTKPISINQVQNAVRAIIDQTQL